MKKIKTKTLMETTKVKSVLILLIIILVTQLSLHYLYGNQGYSAYLYIPIHLFFIGVVLFLASKVNFQSLRFLILTIVSVSFLSLIRGSSNNRIIIKDIKTLLTSKDIVFNDLISSNSLRRELAKSIFNISNEYYYIFFSSNNLKEKMEVILFEQENFFLSDTINFGYSNSCLMIKNGVNKEYCFFNSIEELEFNNDTSYLIVLKSNEISEKLAIDKFLVKIWKWSRTTSNIPSEKPRYSRDKSE
jgi:hypothetical protein